MLNVDLIAFLAFGAAGFVFVFLALGFAGRILRGRTVPTAGKLETYECGEIPRGDARVRFNPRFFLLAVVFIIFDVEIAFLFPWAVVFRETGFVAFADVIVFLAILVAGYAWFWKTGQLRWILPGEEGSSRR